MPVIEDDDDEETLRLKLQAIEARLRLKELQKAKTKVQDVDHEMLRGRECMKANDELDRRIVTSSPTRSRIEVPTSPKRKEVRQSQPESPRRVQLGIDKGVTAKEISLRKARIPGRKEDQRRMQPAAPIKSFSERMAEARSTDHERHEKQERLKQVRSHGFGVGEAGVKGSAVKPMQTEESRTTVPMKTSTPGRLAEAISLTAGSNRTREPSQETKDTSQREPFSNFALSKRLLAESTVSSALDGKALFSIPKLLKTVTSPHYDPPDTTEDDFVVLGIIASKSSAHDTSTKHKTANDTSHEPPATKFMAIKLTDLEWSVDLFLFDSGFDRFWKLTVGTVVAILNPGIMPPKPHLRDTGAFSLKLSSSEDTVLEVGAARDLAFCKSVKRDGQTCGQWVDGRKTEFCEFHVNMQVEKTKAGRMEINSMISLSSFGRNNGGTKRGGGGRGRGRGASTGLKGEAGTYYDREAHEMAYMVPREFHRGAPSAAKLLDADDYVHGGLSKAERSRKRIAAQAKERDIMVKLGANGGGGLGSEYMRAKRGNDEASARRARGEPERETNGEEVRDAASLGLVGGDAAAVRLSPAKGGKAWTGAMKEGGAGWSKAFQRGLPEKTGKGRRGGEEEVSMGFAATKAKTGSGNTDGRVVARPMTPVFNSDDDDDDDLDII